MCLRIWNWCVLAFGRQSELPLFKVPSVMLIELVRSGPLICWLYFAVFMMPDLMDPFYNAEDIIRMLLMFGIFGGCTSQKFFEVAYRLLTAVKKKPQLLLAYLLCKPS